MRHRNGIFDVKLRIARDPYNPCQECQFRQNFQTDRRSFHRELSAAVSRRPDIKKQQAEEEKENSGRLLLRSSPSLITRTRVRRARSRTGDARVRVSFDGRSVSNGSGARRSGARTDVGGSLTLRFYFLRSLLPPRPRHASLPGYSRCCRTTTAVHVPRAYTYSREGRLQKSRLPSPPGILSRNSLCSFFPFAAKTKRPAGRREMGFWLFAARHAARFTNLPTRYFLLSLRHTRSLCARRRRIRSHFQG